MPHHVAALEQLHECFRPCNFIGVTHPSAEKESSTNSSTQSINKYGIECRGCKCRQESLRNFHAEKCEYEWWPIAILTLVYKVFSIIHFWIAYFSAVLVDFFQFFWMNLINFHMSIFQLASLWIIFLDDFPYWKLVLNTFIKWFCVNLWFQSGSNIPSVVAEVSHLNVVKQVIGFFLILIDFDSKVTLTKYQSRIEHLGPNCFGTQTLILNISTIKLCELIKLL